MPPISRKQKFQQIREELISAHAKIKAAKESLDILDIELTDLYDEMPDHVREGTSGERCTQLIDIADSAISELAVIQPKLLAVCLNLPHG